jgi:hypothetical protein
MNNTGYAWKTDSDSYFLRDDTALGIYAEQQTYSLFRQYPDYGRVLVLTGEDINWVLRHAGEAVRKDRIERTGIDIDASTIFLDEFA